MDTSVVGKNKLFFIAGPCVLENFESALRHAKILKEISQRLDIEIIFKSSFDKANRTSLTSFRGPGLKLGLEWLSKIKEQTKMSIITDVHLPEHVLEVAKIADIIQIPAFLCRQTDLLIEAAKSGKIINIKKGQFLAPLDMKFPIQKLKNSGAKNIWITERGSCFGYNNLVVDFRSLQIMREFNCPIIFDATHSVQIPSGNNGSSGGQSEFIFPLAKAAVASGCDAIFMEVHENPAQALCDGQNSLNLKLVEQTIKKLREIHNVVS